MNPVNLITSLTRFQEAAARIDRDKQLRPLERRLQKAIAAAFQEQGRLFLARLKPLASKFDANAEKAAESLRESKSANWLPAWDAAARESVPLFSDPLHELILESLLLGGGSLLDAIDDQGQLGISWNLENPRAVEYARQRAASQVTKINDTTRMYLNSMISQAVDEGWSYDRLSEAIGDRFTEFATGGDNPRSRRVAVYELGDAYEGGQDMMVDEMAGAGVELEQAWLTAGDDRVRPSHRDNAAAGYIASDATFPSGDARPPTDPGCRCVRLFRRKRGK
jgi:hypothetical protein